MKRNDSATVLDNSVIDNNVVDPDESRTGDRGVRLEENPMNSSFMWGSTLTALTVFVKGAGVEVGFAAASLP